MLAEHGGPDHLKTDIRMPGKDFRCRLDKDVLSFPGADSSDHRDHSGWHWGGKGLVRKIHAIVNDLCAIQFAARDAAMRHRSIRNHQCVKRSARVCDHLAW